MAGTGGRAARRGRRTAGAALLLAALTGGATALPAAPAAAAAGGQIAFNRDGNIWVARADGSGARALTHYPGGGAGHPRWSPDGRTLAFTRTGSVWTVRADGTGARRLFPGTQATWSRDGRGLAYALDREVVVRRLPDGPVRTVEGYSDSGFCPYERLPGPSVSWTADGRVLYGYLEHGGFDPLCGRIPSATGVQEASASAHEVWPPGSARTSWAVAAVAPPAVDAAPTGTSYVVATDAGRSDGLARLYLDDGTRRQLTADRGVDAPEFTPDGTSVVYTQHVPGGPWLVRQVGLAAGAAPRTLLTNASQPSVQPAA